ncbi:hypothetical protein M405DRAFT_824550 [Rhizopogon salebrosus TDB-379]|nr:hypothetical protein M405DRAFT_824550 [Rhizopogon salebrosus TDB-379]
MASRLSTWIFSTFKLLKKWTWEDKPETETSDSTNPDSEHLADLTDSEKVVRQIAYATAQGGFGDVWKCRWGEQDDSREVAAKCVRIDISDDHFREIVSKRSMDDFSKWNQLKHDHILPLCGITYGFGPVPAIVSPWMDNGFLSKYPHKYYDNLTETHKISLASPLSIIAPQLITAMIAC